MKVKASVSVGHCSIQVQGMEMTCPFCKTLVRSGEHHLCEVKPAIDVKPAKKKKAFP